MEYEECPLCGGMRKDPSEYTGDMCQCPQLGDGTYFTQVELFGVKGLLLQVEEHEPGEECFAEGGCLAFFGEDDENAWKECTMQEVLDNPERYELVSYLGFLGRDYFIAPKDV